MNENYSDLLKRMGDLMEEVRDFKKEIIKHKHEVENDLIENSNLMSKQRELLSHVKEEINKNNMTYRMNLEEVTKYIKQELLSDIDGHINKKIEEIDNMMKPIVKRVVSFQDSADKFEKTVSKSMIRLRDTVKESDELFGNHINVLDRFSEEIADKKDLEKYLVMSEATLEELVRKLLDEKLLPIIEIIK